MKLKIFFAFLSITILLIGCGNQTGEDADETAKEIKVDGKGIPVPILEYTNATFRNPWLNQLNYGYREWVDEPFAYKKILFDISSGGVISLGPGEEVTIPIERPMPLHGIAVLCSGNYLYNKALNFSAELKLKDKTIIRTLRAYEWFIGNPNLSRIDVELVKSLQIFVDNRNDIGQLGITRAEFTGELHSIRILNDQGELAQSPKSDKSLQGTGYYIAPSTNPNNQESQDSHLMIAGITLLRE